MGIRKLKLMNEAFLLKLLWQLMNRQDAFWVKVLNGKYKVNVF